MNIHERASELVSLAQTYAEDGAFRSSARTLRRLADELEAHDDATRPPVNAVEDELTSMGTTWE